MNNRNKAPCSRGFYDLTYALNSGATRYPLANTVTVTVTAGSRPQGMELHP